MLNRKVRTESRVISCISTGRVCGLDLDVEGVVGAADSGGGIGQGMSSNRIAEVLFGAELASNRAQLSSYARHASITRFSSASRASCSRICAVRAVSRRPCASRSTPPERTQAISDSSASADVAAAVDVLVDSGGGAGGRGVDEGCALGAGRGSSSDSALFDLPFVGEPSASNTKYPGL